MDDYEDPLEGLFTGGVAPPGQDEKAAATQQDIWDGAAELGYRAHPGVAALDFGKAVRSGDPWGIAAGAADYTPIGKILGAAAGVALPAIKRSIPEGIRSRGAFKGSPLKDPVKKGYRTGVQIPSIYDNPRQIAEDAAARFVPESPALKEVFGVTRADLDEINQAGKRFSEAPVSDLVNFTSGAGSKHAEGLITSANTQRILDTLEAGDQYAPELMQGMRNWYTMDPLYDKFVSEFGEELAPAMYNKFNASMGMFSPGAAVPTEVHRGSAALFAEGTGQWDDFMKHGGLQQDNPLKMGGAFSKVQGHPYHSTSQAGSMDNYLRANQEGGDFNDLSFMGSPKVPAYIGASGVPNARVPWQTDGAVPDAHWSRMVGLPDVRKAKDKMDSASLSEYQRLMPWWRDSIAGARGEAAVPNQAKLWALGGPRTGVESPLGQGKLEMIADGISNTARHQGRSAQDVLRDLMRRNIILSAPGIE